MHQVGTLGLAAYKYSSPDTQKLQPPAPSIPNTSCDQWIETFLEATLHFFSPHLNHIILKNYFIIRRNTWNQLTMKALNWSIYRTSDTKGFSYSGRVFMGSVTALLYFCCQMEAVYQRAKQLPVKGYWSILFGFAVNLQHTIGITMLTKAWCEHIS